MSTRGLFRREGPADEASSTLAIGSNRIITYGQSNRTPTYVSLMQEASKNASELLQAEEEEKKKAEKRRMKNKSKSLTE